MGMSTRQYKDLREFARTLARYRVPHGTGAVVDEAASILGLDLPAPYRRVLVGIVNDDNFCDRRDGPKDRRRCVGRRYGPDRRKRDEHAGGRRVGPRRGKVDYELLGRRAFTNGRRSDDVMVPGP